MQKQLVTRNAEHVIAPGFQGRPEVSRQPSGAGTIGLVGVVDPNKKLG